MYDESTAKMLLPTHALWTDESTEATGIVLGADGKVWEHSS